jgi:predicted NBD/HSP70 family sugar kinase
MGPQQSYDRHDLRRLNAVSVLQHLRARGPQSRARIAESLGLTRATVSNIATDLLAARLVREAKREDSGTGRPGVLIELNAACGCIVAVEIDLDRIAVVTADVGQNFLWRKDLSIFLETDPESCLAAAENLIAEGIEAGNREGLPCLGIGVAWAGLVNHQRGELTYGPISGWTQVGVKARWTKRFGLPVEVENEAHAGALAALHGEDGDGAGNLIYLSVGVGLAAGIIADGRRVLGRRGFAGQVGHTFFAENGQRCACGKEGCWVTEIGARAVGRKMADAGITLPGKNSAQRDWIAEAARLAAQGDPRVLEVLHGVGMQVGTGLAALVETFDPALVVIGGRLGTLFSYAEESILEGLRRHTLSSFASATRLQIRVSDVDRLAGCVANVYTAVLNNPERAKCAAAAIT